MTGTIVTAQRYNRMSHLVFRWLTSEIEIGDEQVLWNRFWEETQRKQHEDREGSYFVFFGFIFVIKPWNCLYIVSAFVCRTTSGHKWCLDQDTLGEKEWDFNTRPCTNMGDSDNEKTDQGETGMPQQEQDLEKKIRKEIDKFKFYLE